MTSFHINSQSNVVFNNVGHDQQVHGGQTWTGGASGSPGCWLLRRRGPLADPLNTAAGRSVGLPQLRPGLAGRFFSPIAGDLDESSADCAAVHVGRADREQGDEEQAEPSRPLDQPMRAAVSADLADVDQRGQ